MNKQEITNSKLTIINLNTIKQYVNAVIDTMMTE